MGVEHFVNNVDTTALARETTLAAVLAAVDGLELSADTININLDEVETLITATNAAIAALEAANDISGDDIVTAIALARTTLDATLAALQASNETHSDEVKAAVVSLEAAVTAFNAAFDARDLATEMTLAAFKAEQKIESDATQAILATLLTEATFTAEDFATQTTLEAARALLASLDTKFDVALSTRASEATVATLLTEATFAAEDFSSETTLEAVRVLLVSLDGKDFSTSAKQDTIISELQDIEADVEATNTLIGEVSATPTANTVMDRLKNIYEAVDGLELTLGNIDIDMDDVEVLIAATNAAIASLEAANDISGDDVVSAIQTAETSLNAALAALQASNETHSDEEQAAIASLEAAVTAFKSAFDSRDLATETTLEDVKDVLQGTDFASEMTLLNLKLQSDNILSELDINNPGNTVHSATQTPVAGMSSSEDFTGQTWIDTQQIGNLIFLVAGIEDFVTVELEWSDDGISPNGAVTDIDNTPVTVTPLTYNVYLSILNTFTSGRYVRAHIVNGVTAQTAPPFVGIFTTGKFPYAPLIGVKADLSLILEAVLTRSIIAGNLLDSNNNETDAFGNVFLTANKALTVADIPDEIAIDSSITSGNLPSGAMPAWDPVGPIVAANVIDTGLIPVSQWDYQFFHGLFNIPGVKIFLIDAADDQGNGSLTNSFNIPTRVTKGLGTSDDIGAVIFHKYFRIVIINDSGTNCTDWTFRSIGLHHAVGPVFQPLDSDVFDFYPAQIGQQVIKGRNASGKYRNVKLSDTDALSTRDERLMTTQSGSLFTEGITSHISHIFSRDKGSEAIGRMVKVSAAGSIAHDATEGRAVIATSAANGEVAYYRTNKTLRYDEAAHMLRFEMTGEIPQWPLVGDEEILIGPMEDDGSEGVLNGIVHGFDATGYFVTRIKGGTEVAGARTYSTSFNRNPLDPNNPNNLYRKAGIPQGIDPLKNNYFIGMFEWLGIAPPTYGIQIPAGDPIVTHIEETPNNISGTILQEPNIPIAIRIKNDSSSGRILEYHVGSIRGGTHENRAIIAGKSSVNQDFQDVGTDGKGRLLINSGSDFSRLLQRNVENNEKLKLDVEPTNTTHYIGTAITGTSESATNWAIIGIKLSATKNPTDIEFVQGVAWTDRTNAAHWTFTP